MLEKFFRILILFLLAESFMPVKASFPQGSDIFQDLGLYGGYIYDIAIDPSNPDRIFAATYLGGGLFMSEDGGKSWHGVTTGGKDTEVVGESEFKGHAVWSVRIHPDNPRIIWVAHNYWVDKSLDGGKTWTHILNRTMQRDCTDCGGNGDNFRLTLSLAIDPQDPSKIYVGTSGPLGTTRYGAIYRSEDGGTTWKKMNGGNNFDYAVVKMAIDPVDSQVIWAVTNSFGADPANIMAGTIYRSSDGGDTWTQISTITGGAYTDIKIRPDDPGSVFTASDFGISRHYLADGKWAKEDILKYSTWPAPEGEIWAMGVKALAFDKDSNLYVIFKNLLLSDKRLKIGRGSPPYTDRANWEFYSVDFDFLTMAIHPGNPDIIFAGDTYRGVYKSVDHGQTWASATEGIDNPVTVYDVAVDPLDSSHLVAATSGGLYEKKGSSDWTKLLEPTTYSVMFHPSNSQILYAGLGDTFMKTEDGGATWTSTANTGHIRSIALDPGTQDVIFIATDKHVAISKDGGASFESVLEEKNQDGEAYGFNTIAIDPSDPDHIFAGGGEYNSGIPGDLWESRDGGSTWTKTDLQTEIINALLIDPHNSLIIYAGTGYRRGTKVPVYKSLDGGSTWSPSHKGIPESHRSLYGIWPVSEKSIYAVGDNGIILHYDGNGWSRMEDKWSSRGYADIWGTGDNDMFIVGDNGTILHYDGSAWNSMDSSTKKHLEGIWGTGPSDVFAVGDGGTILHYDGSSWSSMESHTTEHILHVWGTGSTDVFAVGNSGTILHYDGSAWNSMDSSTTKHLEGIWGTGPSDVFAVGDSGTILHYDGSQWTAMKSNTTRYLLHVWGTGSTDVFAVGDAGTILHYDGSQWTTMDSSTTEYLTALSGIGSSNVFAVGINGIILHYDGTTWSVVRESGTPFNAVVDLAFHPANRNVLYAATSKAGIYMSPNGGKNWISMGTPEYETYSIATSSLYVATQGRLARLSGRGVIYGHVRNDMGVSIENATVFSDLGIKATNMDGEYMMVSPVGVFSLTAVASGYANKTVTDVQVLGGDITFMDIAMDEGVSDPSVIPGSHTTFTSNGGGSSCFIATAAYGSPLAGQVMILRRFRDVYLLSHPWGKRLVAFYYRHGKPMAMYMESHPWLKIPVRLLLYPLVAFAWLALSINIWTGLFILSLVAGSSGYIIWKFTPRRWK